ncbi:MAG TPA: MlaD family protein [Casimicrobiaceae bacterium]|nr:MlaD family protein [Casimicrobiaceae bacterium]
MEREARYTLVGAVVVVMLTICTALFIWLRSTGEGSGDHRYKIYFERQSLQGIQRRGDVTMRGVKVGSISNFRFSATRPAAVEVFIAVDANTPVRQSTTAVVERNILTGLASLQLVNGTEDSPLLTQVPSGEPCPVVGEGQSPLQHLSQSIDQLAAHADETMQNLNSVLSPANRAALTDILADVRVASHHVDQTLAKADGAMVSFARASDEVRGLAASLTADAHTLTARYDTLGAEATTTMSEARDAVRRIADDADQLTLRADTLLVNGSDEVRDTARSLRSAADSVGTTAGRLRNPRQIIFGPSADALGPGEGSR